MYELTGQYNTARVYADHIEEAAEEQIRNFLDSIHAYPEIGEGKPRSLIAIMPDCHAGKGCVVGFTQVLHSDHVVPSLVGCDIGCGMLAVKLGGHEFGRQGLKRLDEACHNTIRSGPGVWDKPLPAAKLIEDDLKRMKADINLPRALQSIGTLGGGNHFVELDRSNDGSHWLVIHTGSRHLGLEVEAWHTERAQVIDRGIRAVIGQHFHDYIEDMRIAQAFASLNRDTVLNQIMSHLGFKNVGERIETIHNYIDMQSMIVRKGAIRLLDGERAIIPMNMSDGSLIVVGKGNPEWNFSGPHGAGRLLSRGKAKKNLMMEEFEKSMEGIYSTTVCKDTLDESKMAYKPMEDIVAAIGDTCTVCEVVKPVYNFKATR